MNGVLRTKPVRKKAASQAGPAPIVCRAIEVLGSGLLSHPANRAFRRLAKADGGQSTFNELVRAAYQIMFLALAEPRERSILTRLQSARAGSWPALADLAGALSGAAEFESVRGDLCVPSLGGHLWSPLALPHALDDEVMAEAVTHLKRAAAMCCDMREAGSNAIADGLGVVYEQLLMLRPRLSDNGRGLTLELADETGRKATGSYYTPDALVTALLDSALEPTIRETASGKSGHAAADAVLRLRVCDPACGSGRFLVAAAQRLAGHVAAHRGVMGHASASSDGAARHVHVQAFADVVRYCIRGVDLNPMAVEICRFSLWLASGESLTTLTRWSDGIRCGNALLGVPPMLTLEQSRDPKREADRWCAQAATARGRSGTRGNGTLNAADVTRLASEHGYFHWQLEFPDVFAQDRRAEDRGFNVVLGNPPFLNQLESTTVTSRKVAALIERRYEGQVRGYQDLSATFLLLSTQIVRAGGRIGLVQPQSLLAVADAAPVRAAVLRRGVLESLWVSNAHVFEGASVFTCAPTIRIGGPRKGALRRSHGAEFLPLPDVDVDADELALAPTWAHLAASAHGVPDVRVISESTIAAIADATADFRDQYYGLSGFIIEDDAVPAARGTRERHYPRLITTGLVDLAQSHWGVIATRILKARWRAPRIDRRQMNATGELGPWITARLVPKVLLATQTRVLEAFVDAEGRVVPSLPLITVTPKQSDQIWHLGAAIASPVCTLIAMQRYAGAALNVDAIKLSAKQVLTLPLPRAGKAWDAGAAALRAAHNTTDAASRASQIQEFGKSMCVAHGLGENDRQAVMKWWGARLKIKAEPQKRARTDSNRRPAV